MAIQTQKFEQIIAIKFARRMNSFLVFQRLPNASESQTDGRGRPVSTYTDINPTKPIPCIYKTQSGRELILNGQTKSVTLYSFEIPGLVYYSGAFTSVDFNMEYRIHLLAGAGMAAQFLQVVGGGEDIGPTIKFQAVGLEELV